MMHLLGEQMAAPRNSFLTHAHQAGPCLPVNELIIRSYEVLRASCKRETLYNFHVMRSTLRGLSISRIHKIIQAYAILRRKLPCVCTIDFCTLEFIVRALSSSSQSFVSLFLKIFLLPKNLRNLKEIWTTVCLSIRGIHLC